jgi:hypothetical protein
MSILDKVVAAVSPTPTEAMRQEARARARITAGNHGWLMAAIRHHQQIEAAFAAVSSAQESRARIFAQRRLGVLLTGHANAEEAVLYPALRQAGEKTSAARAFEEQAEAKSLMADLERLAPMSREYLELLEQLRVAVTHHMYEEEGTWFLDLAETLTEDDDVKLTQRYNEEFDRYVGGLALS